MHQNAHSWFEEEQGWGGLNTVCWCRLHMILLYYIIIRLFILNTVCWCSRSSQRSQVRRLMQMNCTASNQPVVCYQ